MTMLGRATATLEPAPRRWLQRLWGVPDIHVRQKWAAIWPQLADLPTSRLRLLDAGCGDGRWTLELGSRRPAWQVTGVDCDGAAVAQAEAARERLDLDNVMFVNADFREASFDDRFDVVLSVASAHYLAAAGSGVELFRTFAGWLRPGGMLCLLGPRASGRNPFSPRLPHPPWHDVFSAGELVRFCAEAGLHVESLSGCIGPAAILAKQLSWASSNQPTAIRGLLYPVEWLMTCVDRLPTMQASGALMWLLKARGAQRVSA
jgi:SAM-dependent methyltransferase